MAQELAQYLNDTSELLHDQNYLFGSQKQLIRWINEARRQIAQRTGCIMRLVAGQSAFGASAQPGIAIPGALQPGALPGALPAGSVQLAAINTLQTIPGVERYPYQGFFNPYLRQTYAGCHAIIDTISCSVNWGGAVRPTLAWLPFEDLQAYARAYATLVTSFPYYWSVFNDGEFGEIWMFPCPSTTGDIELQATCIPIDLQTNDDFEAIPPGFRNAVKYGAAGLAFLTKFNYAQAQLMMDMMTERLGVGRVAVDRGKVPNYYWTSI